MWNTIYVNYTRRQLLNLPSLNCYLLSWMNNGLCASRCTFVCPKINEKFYTKVLDIVFCCFSDTIPFTWILLFWALYRFNACESVKNGCNFKRTKMLLAKFDAMCIYLTRFCFGFLLHLIFSYRYYFIYM